MPYFTYTRLNLYLDLLSVIGFQQFIALWKAFNKSNQIAQLLQRNFAQIFAQTPLKEISTFPVFLEYTFFLHIYIRWVKGFSKMYNWLQFMQFFAHLLLNKILH